MALCWCACSRLPTAPRSRNVGFLNVEVGPEVEEDARRQPFGEDVGELRARWDMEDAHLAERHTLPDEVQVDLHMFCTLVLDRVRGEIRRTDVVTIDHSSTRRWATELVEKLAKPCSFRDTISNRAIFSLRTRSGHRGLSLGEP